MVVLVSADLLPIQSRFAFGESRGGHVRGPMGIEMGCEIPRVEREVEGFWYRGRAAVECTNKSVMVITYDNKARMSKIQY